MGYGLDDVRDRMEAQAIDRAFSHWQKQREQKLKEMQKIGY